MAIASLILGIAALASSWSWVGIICGILGLIFGAMNQDPSKAGMATAGKVMSIIGLVIGLIATIACIACGGCALCDAADAASAYSYYY